MTVAVDVNIDCHGKIDFGDHFAYEVRTQDELRATSTPTVTKIYSGRRLLSAGALNIDLTSLAGKFGDVTLAGLCPVVFGVTCPAANSAALVVDTDLGISSVSVPPGGGIAIINGEDCPTVVTDGQTDVIALTSSDQDAACDVLAIGGAS